MVKKNVVQMIIKKIDREQKSMRCQHHTMCGGEKWIA